MPVGECEMSLSSILDELTIDSWPRATGTRFLRCTGTALNLAVSLLEISYVNHGGRIQLFTAGAATFGPGKIVSENLEDSIRTYHDIKNDKARYIRAASDFYNGLALRLTKNGHAVDLFISAID